MGVESCKRQCKLYGYLTLILLLLLMLILILKNPIINNRSFGENPEKVGRMGGCLHEGMQDNHVLACAKHFPGHGDTDADSHKTLPSC